MAGGVQMAGVLGAVRIPAKCRYNEGMSASQPSQLRNKRICIVGLGLMGGSLALALRPHTHRLTAVERDEDTRRQALNRGIVDEATDNLQAGVRRADVVVLATPVSAILEILARLPDWRRDGCTVLDLGSTKREICAAMERLPSSFGAIGGHPMCGKETSGLAHAEVDLYRDQMFVLCRTVRTDEPTEAIVLGMMRVIGARPLFLQPEAHDRLVATASHLPYFLSALLMQQAAEVGQGEKALWSVSASGFRDTARLSGSSAHMFKDIIQTNREPILQALMRHADELEALIALLKSDDDGALGDWLRARQQEYESYRSARAHRR